MNQKMNEESGKTVKLLEYLHRRAVDPAHELRVHEVPGDQKFHLSLSAASSVLMLHAPVPGTLHLGLCGY